MMDKAQIWGRFPLSKVMIYDVANPPLGLAADIAYQTLSQVPRRLAFGGPAGAGKTELCRLISGTSELLDSHQMFSHPPIPIYNHGDVIKEEVLAWVSKSKARGLIPADRSTFRDFCTYIGISEGMVAGDLYTVLMPVWQSFSDTLEAAYNAQLELSWWAIMQDGQNIEAKVAFVDEYKPIFRSALQLYGEAMRYLTSDPLYWAEKTIARAINTTPCLNGDTRHDCEVDVLKNTGWTTIYLDITEETQKQRRPDMTDEQRAHISEHGSDPKHYHAILDGNQPVKKVLTDLTEILRQLPQVPL
jgi:hypothetical protein